MSSTCLKTTTCPAPVECGPDAGSAGVCGTAGSGVGCVAPSSCDIGTLPVSAETAITVGVTCADDPDGILAALGLPSEDQYATACDEGIAIVTANDGDCDMDAHLLEAAIPEGTKARYICPIACGDCTAGADDGARASLGRAGSLTLGGHTSVTEWGLHFDGVEDYATLQTPAYGDDGAFTYSLWFSKAECNPNAATNWEYMIAHSESENSDNKLNAGNTPGAAADDNVHIYLGCRPGDLGPNSFWRFKS